MIVWGQIDPTRRRPTFTSLPHRFWASSSFPFHVSPPSSSSRVASFSFSGIATKYLATAFLNRLAYLSGPITVGSRPMPPSPNTPAYFTYVSSCLSHVYLRR